MLVVTVDSYHQRCARHDAECAIVQGRQTLGRKVASKDASEELMNNERVVRNC